MKHTQTHNTHMNPGLHLKHTHVRIVYTYPYTRKFEVMQINHINSYHRFYHNFSCTMVCFIRSQSGCTKRRHLFQTQYGVRLLRFVKNRQVVTYMSCVYLYSQHIEIWSGVLKIYQIGKFEKSVGGSLVQGKNENTARSFLRYFFMR